MKHPLLSIPALACALFLARPMPAAAQTHLGQPPASLVTLKLYAGVPGGCGPDGFEFRRMHANDGDPEPDAFRVPAGLALVITDVEWSYVSGSIGTQVLDLFVNTPPNPLGASELVSLLDFRVAGGLADSRSLTGGLVLSEGARVCATITPGGGTLVCAIVRGYLLPAATASAPSTQAEARDLLGQSTPNPFVSSARLEYEVPQDGVVEIGVYDVAGRQVRTLMHGRQVAGRHEAIWDGKDEAGAAVSPGVYFYQLRIGGFVGSKRMVRIK